MTANIIQIIIIFNKISLNYYYISVLKHAIFSNVKNLSYIFINKGSCLTMKFYMHTMFLHKI